jgi:hypothetical protein
MGLPAPSEPSVTDVRGIAYGEARSGWTIVNWSEVGPLCRFAPALFAKISRTSRQTVVKDAIYQHRWVCDICGALTTMVLCDYIKVWALAAVVQSAARRCCVGKQ